MRIMNIASGSSGNVTYVGSKTTGILVDVGISMKKIEEGLNTEGLSLKNIDAIFLTHEHIDHVKGLGVISRKYHIPIYATNGTISGTSRISSLGDFDEDLFQPILSRDKFMVGDIMVRSHSVSHDAADPVCYSFEDLEHHKFVICTDLGYYDESIVTFLKDSDAMLIEANHDVRTLEVGPYPYSLKRRILGNSGHLSNETAGRLIKEILNDHVKAIMLGHLSKENNFPELALETVKQELCSELSENLIDADRIWVESREVCGKMVEL